MKRLRVLAACGGLLLSTLAVEFASADPTPEPASFATIRVSAESLRAPVSSRDTPTRADALISITATVEGRVCATFDLRGASNTDSGGNKVLTIGTQDQPAACRAGSGTIVFIDGGGKELFVQLPLLPGTSQLLTNLVAVPPGAVPLRGFLQASLTAEGVGPVRGDGRTVPGPALLIVPAAQARPLSVREIVPFIYPLERSGDVSLSLPAGDYLVTYSNTNLTVTGVQDSIQVQANELITFPAARVSIIPGSVTSVGLTALARPLIAPRPLITEPMPGGGVIRAPDTGDAGLLCSGPQGLPRGEAWWRQAIGRRIQASGRVFPRAASISRFTMMTPPW